MTISKKEVFLDQLAASHNDDSWFPSLQTALDRLTADQAAWRESPSMNSIWQLVRHLTFWNQTWLNRFRNEITYEKIQNDTTFLMDHMEITEENWKSDVDALNRVLTDWRSTLAECPETRLDEDIPMLGQGAKWWGAISNVCTHNAYHIGQILIIRKKQGSWPLSET
ncbi:DinB family protein [Paenibacillus sedimenti]|uniref:DinB family protein n=1 Tax=Paenibacillus sedimenti TaxID=2770274 RepID=A0A926QKU6_9BACL|nr:DinB family protein [Paenibacillus sedimenti]MBD0383186.1 DinB family protein [Paenibacillus sedimenti]